MDNEKALKWIKSTFRLAIAMSVIALISIIVLMMNNFSFSGVIIGILIYIILNFGLAFGVYKKSRICAVILFIIFISGSIRMLINDDNNLIKFILSVAFAACYFQGIIGTIYYHKNKKLENVEDFQNSKIN